MGKRNYQPEEIVSQLRDVEILRGKGKSIETACRELEISEAVYYRWKKQYAGVDVNQAKRMKQLEKENARLKKLLAETMLDNQILKDLNSKNF